MSQQELEVGDKDAMAADLAQVMMELVHAQEDEAGARAELNQRSDVVRELTARRNDLLGASVDEETDPGFLLRWRGVPAAAVELERRVQAMHPWFRNLSNWSHDSESPERVRVGVDVWFQRDESDAQKALGDALMEFVDIFVPDLPNISADHRDHGHALALVYLPVDGWARLLFTPDGSRAYAFNVVGGATIAEGTLDDVVAGIAERLLPTAEDE